MCLFFLELAGPDKTSTYITAPPGHLLTTASARPSRSFAGRLRHDLPRVMVSSYKEKANRKAQGQLHPTYWWRPCIDNVHQSRTD